MDEGSLLMMVIELVPDQDVPLTICKSATALGEPERLAQALLDRTGGHEAAQLGQK